MRCILMCLPTAQVVIARVISLDHQARRLRLSLAPKTANSEAVAGEPAEALQLGDLVEGVVSSITSKEVHLQAHVFPLGLPMHVATYWSMHSPALYGVTRVCEHDSTVYGGVRSVQHMAFDLSIQELGCPHLDERG